MMKPVMLGLRRLKWLIDERDTSRILFNQENSNSIEAPTVQGHIRDISVDQVGEALKCMKPGKAAGTTESTNDMFKYTGRTGLELLTRALSQVILNSNIPHEWTDSLAIPLFKGKGSALECEKYRELRLLEHGMKIW